MMIYPLIPDTTHPLSLRGRGRRASHRLLARSALPFAADRKQPPIVALTHSTAIQARRAVKTNRGWSRGSAWADRTRPLEYDRTIVLCASCNSFTDSRASCFLLIFSRRSKDFAPSSDDGNRRLQRFDAVASGCPEKKKKDQSHTLGWHPTRQIDTTPRCLGSNKYFFLPKPNPTHRLVGIWLAHRKCV